MQIVFSVPVRKSVSDAALKRFVTHASWQRLAAIAKMNDLKDVVFVWPGRAVIVHYTVPTGRNLLLVTRADGESFPGPIAGHVRAFTTS